ncbi:MAG: polysaccharide biosynthesis/export family protein [Desulfobacterales bacterium]|nr:polysaccharide biosynthesis/export family protein [Desulfobacterales bacterium]
MKEVTGYLIFIVVCLAWLPLAAGEITAGPPHTGYVIGPGDMLEVSVWKNKDLTKGVIVLPDGRISFPLIGEVVAAGKTVAQLKSELEKKLSRYVTDPVLSVSVNQINSMLIYVIGKVRQPGRFVLNANINVLQGLALAGGLTPFAKKDRIRILRQEKGTTTSFSFNYDEVADNRNLAQNILLQRGDVLVVP